MLLTGQSGDGEETGGDVDASLALGQDALLALAEGISHDHTSLGISVSNQDYFVGWFKRGEFFHD